MLSSKGFPLQDYSQSKATKMSDDNIIKQSCFGQISACRTSTTGKFLFGSNVKHHSYITLRINACELHRNGTHDSFFPQERIIEVALSPVQWAEFLTNMNTSGVPCTIQFQQGIGQLKYEPLRDRMNETFSHAQLKLGEHAKQYLNEMLKSINDATLSIKKKEEMIGIAKRAFEYLDGNAKFYLEQFENEADKIVTEAKAAAEAHQQLVVDKLGWDAIEKSKLLSKENT